MKTNLKFLCLFLAMMAMVSCSKDDGDGGGATPTTDGSLVGTWKATAVTANTTVTVDGDSYNIHAVATNINDGQVIYEFKDDGSFSYSQKSYVIQATIENLGIIELTLPAGVDAGSYTRNGTSITLTSDNSENMEILQLNNTVLKVKTGSFTINIEQQTKNIPLTFTYKRM